MSFSGDPATGSVTAGGRSHGFRAPLVTGKAGRHRKVRWKNGKPGFRETGWIVLQNGATRGATNFVDPP